MQDKFRIPYTIVLCSSVCISASLFIFTQKSGRDQLCSFSLGNRAGISFQSPCFHWRTFQYIYFIFFVHKLLSLSCSQKSCIIPGLPSISDGEACGLTQYSKTVNVGTVCRHLHVNTNILKTVNALKQPPIPGNVYRCNVSLNIMALVSGLYTVNKAISCLPWYSFNISCPLLVQASPFDPSIMELRNQCNNTYTHELRHHPPCKLSKLHQQKYGTSVWKDYCDDLPAGHISDSRKLKEEQGKPFKVILHQIMDPSIQCSNTVHS